MTTTNSVTDLFVAGNKIPRLGLLRYTDDSGAQNLVKINRRVFTIGRTKDNDLTLSHDLISRHHAEVVFDGQGYVYHDKSSRGGSFIKQQRISEQPLNHGDAIRLGSEDGATLTFLLSPPESILSLQNPADLQTISPKTEKNKKVGSLTGFGLLNQINNALSQCSDNASVISCLLESLSNLSSVERATVLLYDRKQHEFKVGGSREADEAVTSVTHHDEPVARVLAQKSARRGYDWSRDEFYLCAPMVSGQLVCGAIYLSTRERAFKDEELDLLSAIGYQAGVVLDNLHLLSDHRRTCESLMHALALSIDARDEITAGHSARVAAYSSAIARYLGLSPEEERQTYYAGLLHDYGKIGIRDDVLCKPARLTAEEYETIKQHASYTLSILSKIHFTEDLANVPMVASCHHERPDGLGYPRGLTRSEIPIGGLIIAVADFFDALTVKRHYRQPMPIDEVFALLEQGRDTQFDGTVLDAFKSYYETELKLRLRRE